jgi:secreted trypsin-like serine protease
LIESKLLTNHLHAFLLNSTLVRLGEWDTSTTEDCDNGRGVRDCVDEPVQDIAIEKIIVHENYRKSDNNVHNDIALIRLREPAKLNYFVSPICLPQTDALKSVNLVDKTVFVAGWGITEDSTTTT